MPAEGTHTTTRLAAVLGAALIVLGLLAGAVGLRRSVGNDSPLWAIMGLSALLSGTSLLGVGWFGQGDRDDVPPVVRRGLWTIAVLLGLPICWLAWRYIATWLA